MTVIDEALLLILIAAASFYGDIELPTKSCYRISRHFKPIYTPDMEGDALPNLCSRRRLRAARRARLQMLRDAAAAGFALGLRVKLTSARRGFAVDGHQQGGYHAQYCSAGVKLAYLLVLT